MDKKLVSFSLADGIKSVAPAGYVESLEKLVNDIMIPRELEKMCTQEGRVYNYSFADYQKMQQILYNLLSNAIKFTKNNGKIEITSEANHKNYILKIKDNGIGIEKKNQNKIFKKFVYRTCSYY